MKNSWFSITARDNGPVEIFIFDQVGKDWFSNTGVSAKEFTDALAPHKNRDLIVNINSPGGNVYDGLAIFNTLKLHAGHVETRIMALGASIASVIALAGKKITMAESAMLMIHNPSTFAGGDASVMRDTADMLDKVAGQLANIYSAKTGKPQSEIIAAMNKTTWLTSDEAKEFGLIDEISVPLKMAASFDLTGFRNVPVAILNQSSDVVAIQREAGELRAKLDAAHKTGAKTAVRLLLRGYDVSDATCQMLVEQCATDPVQTELRINRMIEAGEMKLFAAEAISTEQHQSSSSIENSYAAHVARLKKFRNHKH